MKTKLSIVLIAALALILMLPLNVLAGDENIQPTVVA
jgi:hypothetical protein